VAVTGATGFIGRALCRRLTDLGIPVRALVRSSTGAQRQKEQQRDLPSGVTRIRGSLSDPDALAELVRDARVVIHCAGAVRGADRAAFDAVNVDGTAALIDALIDAGTGPAPAARLVLVSTLAARAPQLSDYAASKRAAEALLTAGLPFDHCILRPTAVYGPGDVELQPLLTTMARGLAPIPGHPDHRVTLIHVDDLVDALIAAATSAPGPGPFELADDRDDGYRWPELAAAVSARSGRRVRLLPVPAAVLVGLGRVNRRLARALGRAPMLTPGKARELLHPDWSCDTRPFRRTTGWAPEHDLTAGLATVL
jgi:nucleoside-diphosphate-sugar epimerase